MAACGGASTDDGEEDRDVEVYIYCMLCVYLLCYRIVWMWREILLPRISVTGERA